MTSCRRLAFLGQMLFLLGGTPPALHADTPPTPPTAQQVYNEAQAAFERSDWPMAIKGFASIARPDNGLEMPHYQGVIHSRLSQAYAHQRMFDSAEREAALALKGLGPQDNVERAMIWLAIADAQRYELAMTQAIDNYGKALDSAQAARNPDLEISARIGLALCYMTISPDKAAGQMDTVLAVPAVASYPKVLQAQYYDLRGRASLNRGQAREAMPFLTKALDLSGGFRTSKINLVQVGIRGDAALGALLNNKEEDAHKYLAWSGAGHLPSEEWTRGFGDPPVCSEAADIHPDDLVVVEFSIATDGHVLGAAPIYVSRPGMVGLAFANTVKGWKWNPERIAELPAFWRNLVRVDLRCLVRPDPKGLSVPFREETARWLADSHVTPEDLAPLNDEYVKGDDPRLQRDDLTAIPALLTRLSIETDHAKAVAIFNRLTDALGKSNAPAAARAVTLNLEPADTSSNWSSERVRRTARHAESMERTDPRAAATAWITLEYAIALESNGRFKEARPVLERILAYPPDKLGDSDPVRAVATLHLAALQRHAGDVAGADTQVRAAGITNAQCMLFDVRPVVTDGAIDFTDFSDEALRWQFDGFVRETFDISADGHVTNVRTVLAYPPFVYRSTAEHAVAHGRYLAPAIDGSSVGCEGYVRNLKFTARH